MKKIAEFFPHLAIAMVLGLAVITIVDGFNPMMYFLTSRVSKIYIYTTCGVCFVTAVLCVAAQRRKRRRSSK